MNTLNKAPNTSEMRIKIYSDMTWLTGLADMTRLIGVDDMTVVKGLILNKAPSTSEMKEKKYTVI